MTIAPTADSGALRATAIAAAGKLQPTLRIFALSAALLSFVYIVNAYLLFWQDWPGIAALLGSAGLFGFEAPNKSLGDSLILAWLQAAAYIGTVAIIAFYVLRTRSKTLHTDAQWLSAIGAYIARAAFWSVLLVGLTDAAISFLRVEGVLPDVVGKKLAQDLGRSSFRGQFVHIPLILVGMAISLFSRTVGFTWLALLVVVAELQIVILRFIFSYEQAFMADLVRFWYAGLFLFASAYTLLHEGHVRVDVLYSGFGPRKRAWVNALGSVFLGGIMCWVVLTMGLANKFSVISGPLQSFEVSQSGFGLYVKYMLAGYLLVFAVTMLIEFMASLLSNAGVLLQEKDAPASTAEEDAHS
ncbi:MAG: TRAP transporter small permease subunit [Rhodospirillaceae bacterium]|nr:TRAP transporter small permease subunit [Rhodospirillaceae bacterium]MCY4237734.1 TRAP transporter small permease subunit [Rhodospirillaceae bacterium]